MKKRTIVVLLIAVGVVVAAVYFLGRTNGSELVYESAVVQRGDVRNVVSVTGHVEPLERLELAFTLGGVLAQVPTEGTRVAVGDTVARLDAGVFESQVAEAEARLAREQAVLNDVLAPPRTEEEEIKRIAVENAARTLEQARWSAATAIARSFTYADDALHEEADELFRESRGESPEFGIRFSYGTTEYILSAPAATKAALTSARADAEVRLDNIQARINSADDPLELIAATDADLLVIETFLSDLADVVNRYIPDDTLAQTVYESFQTSVASARTALATARADITAARSEYQAAENTLLLAERDLSLILADAPEFSVSAQQASVIAAQQSVGTALERISDMVLRAPIEGIVAAVEHSVGETIAPYEHVALLITEGAYELEAFIPEADIADVKLGDSAVVTLDAFERSDEFTATVARIALTETYREGVPTYKTTLILQGEVPEGLVVRPGMTADIEIATDDMTDVLYIPSRSVLREGSRTYVRIVENGELAEQDITVGLRGSAGTTEVVSGLSEGDEIVLFVEEP